MANWELEIMGKARVWHESGKYTSIWQSIDKLFTYS